jgi:hypothetical protein
MVGIALIVAGALALIYGGFSYTRETHQAQLGPIALTVTDRERVNVPLWAGVVAVAAGALMLLVAGKPR